MKIYNKKIIKNVVLAGYLLAGTFGATELLYGGNWNEWHWAVYRGDTNAIGRIIAGGVLGLEAKDERGRTPFRLAVDMQNIDAVECLTGAGSDVNTQDCEGETPLMSAVRNGNLRLIDMLIKAGADVNQGNFYHLAHSPLGFAIVDINLPAVKMLLEAGTHVRGGMMTNRDTLFGLIGQYRGSRLGSEGSKLIPIQLKKIDEIYGLLEKKYMQQMGWKP
jgi:ankyrin repeat protein